MPRKIVSTAAINTSDDDIMSVHEAAERWRSWAQQIAEGGPMPPTRMVVVTAFMLGLQSPTATLAKDVAVLREVRDLEANAAKLRAQMAEANEAEGGLAQIQQRVSALEAEIDRLRNIGTMHSGRVLAGQYSGRASRLRDANPRLFSDCYGLRPEPCDMEDE